MSSRPKTSHTTIERRYRTNLNARIQSLRMAVPALRVLEWNDGTKKSKGTKARLRVESDKSDQIDDRGFVDGVRVARKCSKANVLGKAVEYIAVLKKRETRLRREQDGLKALVSGLVGGPQLLNAWEKEWHEKFGGEEKDEVDGLLDDMGDSDDEDGDEEEDRKRKKPKISPLPPTAVPPPAPSAPGAVPEKRKRGRPRKVVPPPPAPDASVTGSQTGVPQYLLSTFALFTFFNNPLTSPSPSSPHPHDGVVLSPGHQPAAISTYQYIIQCFHLLVSIAIFVSVLWPWLSTLSLPFKFGASGTAKHQLPSPKMSRTTALSTALRASNRAQVEEVNFLKKALASGPKNATFEEKGLEQRAWVRLGEICVFNPGWCSFSLQTRAHIRPEKTSLFSRLQTIYHLRSHLPWFSASAGDLSTFAMLLAPLAPGRAAGIWDAAARDGMKQGRGCAYERLVLASVNVQEAVTIVNVADKNPRYTPLGVVGSHLALQRLRRHLIAMFVDLIIPPHLGSDTEQEEEARRTTVDSARSLGGELAKLGDLFEDVWNGGNPDLDDLDEDAEPDCVEVDLLALLNAVVLYRQLFPSAVLGSSSEGVSILLSPPPSPLLSDNEGRFRLRTVLAMKVFDEAELEDARDTLVDMLVSAERGRRSYQ